MLLLYVLAVSCRIASCSCQSDHQVDSHSAGVNMQSFYFDDKPVMNNDEFDNLKEELIWAGSSVAVLRCLVLSTWPLAEQSGRHTAGSVCAR